MPPSSVPYCFQASFFEKALQNEEGLHLQKIMAGKERMDARGAQAAALAFKAWGHQQGSKFFAFWFQSLASVVSGKPGSFLSSHQKTYGEKLPIETLSGSILLRHEVKMTSPEEPIPGSQQLLEGFLKWDEATFPFIAVDASGIKTLLIPGLFFSLQKEALDQKIPLFRSEDKIRESVLRLLRFCSAPQSSVNFSLGIAQQFYLVDQEWCRQRNGLLRMGRESVEEGLVCLGQAVNNRIPSFLCDLEAAALQAGLFMKVKPVEEASLQFEVACRPATSAKAVDQHIQVLEMIQKMGSVYGLIPLFHAKPFASKLGSFQRLDWAIMTEEGENLFKSKKLPKIAILIILTAVIYSIYEYADLLYAVSHCPNYDDRLYPYQNRSGLNLTLSKVDSLDTEGSIDWLSLIDTLIVENDDATYESLSKNLHSIENKHGDRLTFQGMWISLHPSFLVSTFEASVADTLSLIIDELSDAMGSRIEDSDACYRKALPTLHKRLKTAKQGLLNRDKSGNQSFSPECVEQFVDRRSLRCFEGILGEEELRCRYFLYLGQYAQTMETEAREIAESFRSRVLPALLKDFGDRKEEIPQNLSFSIESTIKTLGELDTLHAQCRDLGSEIKAKVFFEIGVPKMVSVQQFLKLWLPKTSRKFI